jgi:hypothetical protein
LIIPITFGEQCKLWNSSLYSFLQPPVTLSLLGLNILIPIQNHRQNYSFVYSNFLRAGTVQSV